MSLRRAAPALALIALIVAGVAGVFLLAANATAQPGGGYGYETHSPTPSRTKSRSASPSPSGTLPVTGADPAQIAVTGLATFAAGVVLLSVWWVWQALNRDGAQVRSRSHMDRRPGHRHERLPGLRTRP